MVKVESKETLHLLTKRFMKINKARNGIAALAIILTSVLFTSVFTGAFSMIKSQRESEIRKSSCSSHAMVQDVTKKEYEKLLAAVKADPHVLRYGMGTFLGIAVNDSLKALQTEIRYGDGNQAESFNCRPTTGTMPKEEDELACSTVLLDRLQVKHELGSKVTLSIQVLDQVYEKTFRLCGYWEGDLVPVSQLVWISEVYKGKICPDAQRQDLENGAYEGGYEIAVWFSNPFRLEEKTEALNQAAGIKDTNIAFESNPAYLLFAEDGFSFPSLFFIIAFIMLAGYLIIYNVFSISVNMDIRAYGLLKNIGTTGSQLKKIVRMQALRISAVGIPLGLLAGFGIGCFMMPFLMSDMMGNGENTQISYSVNPLLFLASAVFSLLTVYLACIKPCRIVDKLSAVEALRMADGGTDKRKAKRNTSVSAVGMAFENIRRNLIKGGIVMISLALSMITVNCIAMLVSGFDFKEFIHVYLASDFSVSKVQSDLRVSDLEGIGSELQEILDKCPGSKSVGYVYYAKEEHALEEKAYEAFEQTFDLNKNKELGSYSKNIWEDVLKNKTTAVHLMGMNQSIFEKLEWLGEECTWEEFESGEYVISDYPTDGKELHYYQKGSSFLMKYKNGGQKEYKVLGEARLPYALDYPFADPVYLTIMIPESEFIKYTGKEAAMFAAIDAEDGREKEVAAYIEEKVAKRDSDIVMNSILEFKQSFQNFLNKYYFIGGMLAAVLAFIGVMNFFNTSATSILIRKRELSLLEVVGMTKRQIKRMLVMEGLFYLLGAFILAVLILITCAEHILANTVGVAFFYHMKLTVWPCVFMLLPLGLVACLIPSYNYKIMRRESIVDRVRSM